VPSADVVVIGAGLAGLTAAIAAAESGARVHVLAKGHAATHWGPGGIDVAGIPAASTPRDGIHRLAGQIGHPYAFLGDDVAAALEWIRPHLAAGGVEYVGDLDTPLQLVPTSIGGTRRAAILPAGQAAALSPWAVGERLVICGIAGFKDFWPEAIAASLSRERIWEGGNRPASVIPVSVALPGLAARHNLDALEIARRFDDPAWRATAIEAMARAIASVPGSGGRVALPAVLGIREHAAVLAAAQQRLPAAPFEMPLVPPSVPGMRLYAALRAALIRAGGRVQIGEMIQRVEHDGRRVTAVVSAAAARTFTVRTGALVLATGGIAGGGWSPSATAGSWSPSWDSPWRPRRRTTGFPSTRSTRRVIRWRRRGSAPTPSCGRWPRTGCPCSTMSAWPAACSPASGMSGSVAATASRSRADGGPRDR